MAASLRMINIHCPRMEAMFNSCINLKTATTFLVLAFIAATGLAPGVQAVPYIEQDGVKPAAVCACAAPCCCGISSEPQACSCRPNDTPSPRPPATPNDSSRTLKWTPWTDSPLGGLMIAPSERSIPVPSQRFITPLQRSIQSLFCIWRI